jgi:CheY-like chemotaxis protein
MRVIMITANEGSRHKAYAEMLGVDDYIRKPFAMDRLVDSVRAAAGVIIHSATGGGGESADAGSPDCSSRFGDRTAGCFGFRSFAAAPGSGESIAAVFFSSANFLSVDRISSATFLANSARFATKDCTSSTKGSFGGAETGAASSPEEEEGGLGFVALGTSLTGCLSRRFFLAMGHL